MQLHPQTSLTHTFHVSGRWAWSVLLGLGILTTLLVLITAGVTAPSWDGSMVAVTAGMVALVWVVQVSMGWLLLRRAHRESRLHVGSDGVCRKQAAVRQLVPWTTITRVRIRGGGETLTYGRRRERWERIEQDASLGRIAKAVSWLKPRPPEPRAVEVYTAEGQALNLMAYEHLGEIAKLIEAGVSPGTPVDRG